MRKLVPSKAQRDFDTSLAKVADLLAKVKRLERERDQLKADQLDMMMRLNVILDKDN